MNGRLIVRFLGSILLIEAAAMAPSLLISLIYQDGQWFPFIITILLLCAAGLGMRMLGRTEQINLRAREGFLCVALAWILLAAFGALPFTLSGLIPNYIDAFFEAVSGFTTTGATVLTDFDNRPEGIMFWRSFTHWIGGMGVLVLTLALLPQLGGRTSHLVRAESPGPTLSKIAPRMGDTAKILYMVYAMLTLVTWIALLLAGMNPYDAAIHSFGTAGTGGFSNYAASVGHFNSPAIDWILTFFMVLFGINFTLFYRLLLGDWHSIRDNEELKWYLALYAGVMLLITIIILPEYEGFTTALRYAAFQTATIISTTGYATTDFNIWPVTAKMLLLIVMITGSCAGSTAGGLKICRVGMLCKQGMREVRRTFQPRRVQVVRFDGKGVDEDVLHQVAVFAVMYALLVVLGAMLLSFEGLYDFETNLTAALTCVSNVGPGFGAVGPAGNFASYGPLSKLLLSLLMLAGRLEILPMLALFHPAMWRK